ncbi:DUF3348 domain-containing protein [Luteibacter sp. 329MFSha]|uniref:DUF3348 domain-containing protein n=1 Tax=Luteibacter sp. 329MFSha TaxID=1798239 RepID=UPI000B7EF510|nr:DUF3348 domain-containing protein [Luteibacter sp. 329MFSha]
MVQATRRTTVRGPTFIRLLARLADVDAPQSSQSLPDHLSGWLNWTQAIALSTALDGRLPEPDDEAPAFEDGPAAECARLREALAETIANARELVPSAQREPAQVPPVEGWVPPPPDYAPYRQRYLTLQRAMQGTTGRLRGELRDLLGRASEDMARLAELDAVMELALSPREQRLLGTVPGLLETHFERLRRAHAGEGSPDAPATATHDAWLDIFRKDMQSVLLAELDVRFQPVEGLLAALRAR